MNLARYILAVGVLLCMESINAEPKSTDVKDTTQTIDVISANISSYQQKIAETEKQIGDKIREIKEIIDDYNNSDRSVKGPTGLGRIEQLELKAERYAIERQARKRIEKEVNDLIEYMNTWDSYKNQVKEARKLLVLKQKILSLESNPVSEDAAKINTSKDKIEYYQVKKEATLKEISALPDVYGNATSWKLLYDANRDKIKDPAKPVPEGTTLMVPNIKGGTDFDDLQ